MCRPLPSFFGLAFANAERFLRLAPFLLFGLRFPPIELAALASCKKGASHKKSKGEAKKRRQGSAHILYSRPAAIRWVSPVKIRAASRRGCFQGYVS